MSVFVFGRMPGNGLGDRFDGTVAAYNMCCGPEAALAVIATLDLCFVSQSIGALQRKCDDSY